MIAATPKKLRSGDWGALAQGAVNVGDALQVTTKSGKSWSATVTAVIWQGKGVTICATGGSGGSARRSGSGRRRSGRCRTSGCGNPADLNAAHCRATEGYCGYCAYDEYGF